MLYRKAARLQATGCRLQGLDVGLLVAGGPLLRGRGHGAWSSEACVLSQRLRTLPAPYRCRVAAMSGYSKVEYDSSDWK